MTNDLESKDSHIKALEISKDELDTEIQELRKDVDEGKAEL